MQRWAWIVVVLMAGGAEAQWWTPVPTVPPRTPTPRPTATATPRPVATPTPARTPTPAPTVAPGPTPPTGTSPCPAAPLLRLRPVPFLVDRPAVGQVLRCGIDMLAFGCSPGQPVEQHLYHTEAPDEAPAVYHLVRVR